MRIAIVGATKGMGRSLARALAERGDQLYLWGRDIGDLELAAADLRARSDSRVAGFGALDFEAPEMFDAALDAAEKALGKLDGVIVTAGFFNTQDKLEQDPAFLARLMTVNYTNTVLFCENARKRLIAGGGGLLCVFSSVAGDRGRKPVILYGSSKAGLSHYLEGLDHKFHASGLHVLNVKPGFVKTGMTAGLPSPPFAGDPDAVARTVIRAIEKKRAVVYAPPIWGLILRVIRTLPRFVMRKINF
ncbi:MAG: SDR family NAD(P)-dependent oxidoreductase [Gemmatimonadetes bacterium]|nr:SDR family NAD(P)-dependent oxidoreductase [Gemmatimonadota bacterium]